MPTFVSGPNNDSRVAFPLRSAETAHTTPQPGIEQITQGVAKHVEAEDGDHQGHPRPEGESRIGLHVLTSLPIEHPPQLAHHSRVIKNPKIRGQLLIVCNGFLKLIMVVDNDRALNFHFRNWR